jgi:hypothetical protein
VFYIPSLLHATDNGSDKESEERTPPQRQSKAKQGEGNLRHDQACDEMEAFVCL